ncbi:alpha-amylase family protein [Corynebacterium callunae]|uniref:Cyclomaltodextrinase n=1 Tax=Corynebacterium callunae DSM 20147 TaxID=1121353 RepID=M1UE43_9CORY|nr:alpha-amylase family protein [Corynebacterium callunae]AGG66295.1 cyclomaltodextrinase [Corynebacterium callunae DSM 20147]
MSFAEHAIIWQVYPLGAVGAPIRPAAPEPLEHRLPTLEKWLDYVVELGCNVLLLGPVFEALSHGYDTLDFYRVDPRLGDQGDMTSLLDAAQQRGIGVLFDGVFNHVSSSSKYAQLTTGNSFEGHEALAELDHENPEVVELVVDVMNYWLDRGIAGWRLDAVYATSPKFWAQVIPRVKQRHPDAWIMGEMIHGDYVAFRAESGIDSITQYELWKAIWSSIKENNFFELEWTLGRHNEFLESFVPQTFIGNHDVTRIASQLGQERAVLAAAILFTVGGTPSIYYGDEQGFSGVKEEREAGDDAVRPPLPEELSPLGKWIEDSYKALISLRRQHPWLHHARTEIQEIENQKLTYRAVADEQWIEVQLDIEHPSVRISDAAGTELFSFSAS